MNRLKPEEYAELAIQKLIKKTTVPILNIALTDEKTTIFDSKIGGTPYLPKDMEIPKDKNGRQMRLLAQINCKDLTPLEDYPHSGILQFWLTVDFMWEEYEVAYHKNIDYTLDEKDILPRIQDYTEGKDGSFPVNGEYGMEFVEDTESMGHFDYRIEALFCQYYTELSGEFISIPEDADEEVYDIFIDYRDDAYTGFTKIGGYEISTQLTDYLRYRPENYDTSLHWSKYATYVSNIDMKSDEEEFVLFQLDSHYNNSKDYKVG
ncbi:MAG: DUF1963 domain-containing protein [Oscillospiraceae bacterium]|nr:DUF1963 domain-containing protein [Oscillospiraceae bacterium]